ncbi:hypothetical protein Nepgr_018784 [Nepenthes gracilis]|uniref:Uncharacterized protein n=1 Tax=Nepenthes gracilis TaxID=150966 RepID=A0AAD3SST5_NEPGR|nr:hypothetical protein Nepgr_018784 [Nepenthes gracilis]
METQMGSLPPDGIVGVCNEVTIPKELDELKINSGSGAKPSYGWMADWRVSSLAVVSSTLGVACSVCLHTLPAGILVMKGVTPPLRKARCNLLLIADAGNAVSGPLRLANTKELLCCHLSSVLVLLSKCCCLAVVDGGASFVHGSFGIEAGWFEFALWSGGRFGLADMARHRPFWTLGQFGHADVASIP